MPRSNDGGLTLCYALRRLASNIQEPYRTLSLQAIDASITWWQGKPAPRASALRAPWSLSPNLQRTLKQFLRKWHLQVLAYQVPCHTPSFKTVFIKHAAVLDQLCNHKQAISQWSTEPSAICCCQHRSKYKKAALNPLNAHWVLAGSLLHDLLPADLAEPCRHCRGILGEQSLSIQEGLSSQSEVCSASVDETECSPIHTVPRHHGPGTTSMATTQSGGHMPNHKIVLHHLPNLI